MTSVAFISHPACRLHEMGRHPEQPARLAAIEERLRSTGLYETLDHREAPAVDLDLLRQVHAPFHVDAVIGSAPAQGYSQLDPDTAMNPHSLEAALRAAGAAQFGVDLVLSGEVHRAFCAVRPPGHHAERNRAMGFCLFNNVATAARHALYSHGLERVAILDFDVHHGNGTEDIVAGEERILFCSTFQHPFYPGSGIDCDAPNVVNTPLPAGSDGAAFRAAVERDWLPRLRDFAPQLLLVSAGFDGHEADPLAGLNLREADYRWVTARLCEQANASAAGRVVSCLEGGYDLDALARSVEQHLRALLDDGD
ncbi:MAG: histone deacetylase family protein [Halioglobus sp.]|nr:histone deacetylase family protein [Halioglobus sp.]